MYIVDYVFTYRLTFLEQISFKIDGGNQTVIILSKIIILIIVVIFL